MNGRIDMFITLIFLWALLGFAGWWLAIRNDDTLSSDDIIALALALVLGPCALIISLIVRLALSAPRARFKNPFKRKPVKGPKE